MKLLETESAFVWARASSSERPMSHSIRAVPSGRPVTEYDSTAGRPSGRRHGRRHVARLFALSTSSVASSGAGSFQSPRLLIHNSPSRVRSFKMKSLPKRSGLLQSMARLAPDIRRRFDPETNSTPSQRFVFQENGFTTIFTGSRADPERANGALATGSGAAAKEVASAPATRKSEQLVFLMRELYHIFHFGFAGF